MGTRERKVGEYNEAEDVPVSVVGEILFAGGKKLARAGVDGLGSLSYRLLANPNLDELGIDRNSRRFLDLSKYDNVRIVKVGLGSITLGRQETVLSQDESIWARLTIMDPGLEKEEYCYIDEISLLKMIVGEEGGLAVFHGEGKPEEIALVIRRPNNQALVAFLRPEDRSINARPQLGLKSVQGVADFFNLFYRDYQELRRDTPLIREVITETERAIRKGKIDETSQWRLAILKAQLVAHARLAVVSGEEEHLDFLLAYFPDLGLSTGQKVARALGIKRVRPQLDLGQGEGLVVGFDREKTPVEEEKKRAIPLKTQKCKVLYDHYHDDLGQEFGDGENNRVFEAMGQYLLSIIRFINESTNDLDTLTDLGKMLAEIAKTPYGKERPISCWKMKYSNSWLECSNYFAPIRDIGTRWYWVREIIDNLQRVIEEIKAPLVRERAKMRAGLKRR